MFFNYIFYMKNCHLFEENIYFMQILYGKKNVDSLNKLWYSNTVFFRLANGFKESKPSEVSNKTVLGLNLTNSVSKKLWCHLKQVIYMILCMMIHIFYVKYILA